MCETEGEFSFKFPSWKHFKPSQQQGKYGKTKVFLYLLWPGRHQQHYLIIHNSCIYFKQGQTIFIHIQSLLHPNKASHSLATHSYRTSLPVPGQLEKPFLICGRGNSHIAVSGFNKDSSASITKAVPRPQERSWLCWHFLPGPKK